MQATEIWQLAKLYAANEAARGSRSPRSLSRSLSRSESKNGGREAAAGAATRAATAAHCGLGMTTGRGEKILQWFSEKHKLNAILGRDQPDMGQIETRMNVIARGQDIKNYAAVVATYRGPGGRSAPKKTVGDLIREWGLDDDGAYPSSNKITDRVLNAFGHSASNWSIQQNRAEVMSVLKAEMDAHHAEEWAMFVPTPSGWTQVLQRNLETVATSMFTVGIVCAATAYFMQEAGESGAAASAEALATQAVRCITPEPVTDLMCNGLALAVCTAQLATVTDQLAGRVMEHEAALQTAETCNALTGSLQSQLTTATAQFEADKAALAIDSCALGPADPARAVVLEEEKKAAEDAKASAEAELARVNDELKSTKTTNAAEVSKLKAAKQAAVAARASAEAELARVNDELKAANEKITRLESTSRGDETITALKAAKQAAEEAKAATDTQLERAVTDLQNVQAEASALKVKIEGSWPDRVIVREKDGVMCLEKASGASEEPPLLPPCLQSATGTATFMPSGRFMNIMDCKSKWMNDLITDLQTDIQHFEKICENPARAVSGAAFGSPDWAVKILDQGSMQKFKVKLATEVLDRTLWNMNLIFGLADVIEENALREGPGPGNKLPYDTASTDGDFALRRMMLEALLVAPDVVLGANTWFTESAFVDLC